MDFIYENYYSKITNKAIATSFSYYLLMDSYFMNKLRETCAFTLVNIIITIVKVACAKLEAIID